MAKEEASDTNTFSVRELNVALPLDNSVSPAYPGYVALPLDNSVSPAYPGYVALPRDKMISPPAPDYEYIPPPNVGLGYYTNYKFSDYKFDPSPPGLIVAPPIYFHHGDWKEQSQDKTYSVLEARREGRTGLHCHNLEKGTNLQFLGVRERTFTGIGTIKATFEAEDPLSRSTHKFDAHVFARRHKDFVIVIAGTVPAAPERRNCRCYSILVTRDYSVEDDIPDWFPVDANYMQQYYEMKKKEVEENKDWLQLYAELGLFSKIEDYYSLLPIELGKVTVESNPVVGLKNQMVKAENAIFYMSFKTSDGQNYKCVTRRTSVGRPGESRLSLKIKCIPM